MRLRNSLSIFAASALCFSEATFSKPNAHPHVFIEASLEIVLNDKGEFHELRHVWRFDELFTYSLIVDFDADGSGVLDAKEIEEITTTVVKSIAEYDYYTALRLDNEVLKFYRPENIKGYMDGDRMIMFLAIEPEKPVDLKSNELRISASDTSYYVAFEIDEKNIKVTGANADKCSSSITHPDFDKLYAEGSQTLDESYLNEEGSAKEGLGDDFYSWVSIKC